MWARLVCLCALSAVIIAAEGNGRTPVIVELFTSEGCSDCPPADTLLGRLAQSQPIAGAQLIALEEHVDYWDRLGWKDPFSAAVFTARQEQYARVFNQDSSYTPEMVVNGQAGFVGSDASRAQREIVRAMQGPRASVSLTRRDPNTLSVRVTNLPAHETADVLAIIAEDNLTIDVRRGENSGRQLTHWSVVRSLVSLGRFEPKKADTFEAEAKLSLAPEWKRENLHVVVLVQGRNTLRILGAATLGL